MMRSIGTSASIPICTGCGSRNEVSGSSHVDGVGSALTAGSGSGSCDGGEALAASKPGEGVLRESDHAAAGGQRVQGGARSRSAVGAGAAELWPGAAARGEN